MNGRQVIMAAITVIAVGSWGVFFFGVLYILVGTGLLPWWVVIAPAVIVGLVGLGLILKVVDQRKEIPPPVSPKL